MNEKLLALSGVCLLIAITVVLLMKTKLLVIEPVPASRRTRAIAYVMMALGAVFLLRWLLR